MEVSSTEDYALVAPRLPPELERVIFEFAALSRRSSIPCLMRIAWRVKNWVEPLLYQVVFITSSARQVRQMHGFPLMPVDLFIHAIATKPPSFFATSVRHLFLQSYLEPPTVAIIFAACANLQHLYYTPFDHDPPAHRMALDSLQCLKQLTFFITDLFPTKIDFTRPIFRNITHLEMLDTPHSRMVERLILPPRLTHIAFHPGSVAQYTTLQTWLLSDTQLVCILFLLGGPISRSRLMETAAVPDDDRFLFMGQTGDRADWLRVVAGEGYWVLAEAFISAKRTGQLDRSLRGLDQHGSLARQLLSL
ncbi:hypothetical protein C8F04DRAFT_1234338 [Mycena alexandri]|uniref:Uncharacterized protein n=1 Tax=Mycena alexandri TaxID=1745969 RepID=A0AAD6SWD2_9AGAR|nr:hypothetical protein C8F04DRAFT_1234338 [Mycena alexandri]